jgi:hypothetical protein
MIAFNSNRILAIMALLMNGLACQRGVRADDIRAEITRAIDRSRAATQSVKLEYRVTYRICKGSYTETARDELPSPPTSAVPSEDIVLEYDIESLIEFQSPRGWSKGGQVDINVPGNGGSAIEAFVQWKHSAFDGRFAHVLQPRQRMDARNIPKGIKYPVEYLRLEVPDGGLSSEIAEERYSLYFWAGGVAEPGVALTPGNHRSAYNLADWRIIGPLTFHDVYGYSLTTPPSRSGAFDEYLLEREMDYRPRRWVRHWRNGRKLIIETTYTKNSDSSIIPASWTVQTYDPVGTLTQQSDFRVTSIAINPLFDTTDFELSPADGMVMELISKNQSEFRLAGNEQLHAQTNYALNRLIDSKTKFWWIAVISVGIGLLVLLAVGAWCWRRLVIA